MNMLCITNVPLRPFIRLAIPWGVSASRRLCAASCRALFSPCSVNVHTLAHDILALPWAATYDWQDLADQARSLEPDHRTLIRVKITLRPCSMIYLHVLKRPGAGAPEPARLRLTFPSLILVRLSSSP